MHMSEVGMDMKLQMVQQSDSAFENETQQK
jgi:hypothetical protein